MDKMDMKIEKKVLQIKWVIKSSKTQKSKENLVESEKNIRKDLVFKSNTVFV